MALFAIAIPVVAGKSKEFKEFVGHLAGDRHVEFAASRKALGVREQTFLQHTPQGEMVVVTLEGNDPAGAFSRFGSGTDPFTVWFKSKVKEIHGVDLDAPPPGPMPTLLVDSAK